METTEILAKLDGVTPEGEKQNQWNARCPAHEDRNASLSIGRGDTGETLLHCQAGCSIDEITAALGVEKRDLFERPTNGKTMPDGQTKPRGKIVQRYEYRDEANLLLYEVVRMDPKDFRQRCPDGKGGWRWKLKGVSRLLYRLSEVVAAQSNQWVFYTEGEKDADRLSSDVTATTLAGGAKRTISKDNREALKPLHGRRVCVVPDNDKPGRQYAHAVAKELSANGSDVCILELPDLPEKGDVSDWLDAGHTPSELVALADAAQRWTFSESQSSPLGEADVTSDSRPRIELKPGCEDQTVSKAMEALRADPDVYKMNGQLVRVGEVESDNTEPYQSGRLVIAAMGDATIRVHLARAAACYVFQKVGGIAVESPRSWPLDIIKAIAADHFWYGFRSLSGTVTTPVMRPDGSILDTPGYDAATQLIFDPVGDIPEVVARPTREDAKFAANMLADLFADFPHENDRKGVAGCVAGILTLVGRPMIAGPCPMFLVDGNRSGAGKTKIVDAIGEISGLPVMPRKSLPQDDTEFRKTITGVASAALPAMLLDNVARPLGGDALDAVLTSDVWQDRRLGSNEMQSFSMRTIWFATGNNIVLRGDTYRRVLRISLDCRHENPETRNDFRYPNLLEHVRANRTKLRRAALTMLRAWHVAGRPDCGLDTWGSFEAFSRVVRGTLVYAGMSDPAPAADRLELANTSDTKRAAIPVLLNVWPIDMHGDAKELKASDLAKLAEEPSDLRDAIEQLMPNDKTDITGRTIGYALRGIRGQVVGGRRLVDRESRNKTKLWTVEVIQ